VAASFAAAWRSEKREAERSASSRARAPSSDVATRSAKRYRKSVVASIGSVMEQPIFKTPIEPLATFIGATTFSSLTTSRIIA
jgi:hypothetical protein